MSVCKGSRNQLRLCCKQASWEAEGGSYLQSANKNKIGQSFTQIVPGFIAYGNGVKEDRIIGEREIIYGRINSVPSTKMYCELFAFSVLHVYIPV